MKINKLQFFITKSRGIKFTTGEYISNSYRDTLISSIVQIKQVYMQRSFIIKRMLMDGQFKGLENSISKEQITLNIDSRAEHVSEVERMIRTIKERARGIYSTLPFKKLPGRLIIELVAFCI